MLVVRLESLDDPRFVDRERYRVIGDHEQLRARGLFVAEGRLVVQRLLERQACLTRSLLLNDAAYRALPPAAAQLSDDVVAYVCDTPAFETLTGFNIHRGCLALAARPPQRALEPVVAAARTLVLVEDVGNADNVGGIFRNAAAFGVSGVILSGGCADPLYRKSIRTSMGGVLTVPFATITGEEAWNAMFATLRRHGCQLVALTPDPSAVDIGSFARNSRGDRVALLVGTEGAGLTAQSQATADVRVRIPIRSDVDSLNVAVATGIALHTLATPG
jgi:tRNA G18 (ribose-2'-O)-methylase SpoU